MVSDTEFALGSIAALGFMVTLIFMMLQFTGVIEWPLFFIYLPLLIGWGIPILVSLVIGLIILLNSIWDIFC